MYILVNMYHIGDTFMAKSLVSHLIRQNPVEFRIFMLYNSYMYSDVPVKIEPEPTSYTQEPVRDYARFLIGSPQHQMTWQYFRQIEQYPIVQAGDDTIINFWIGAWKQESTEDPGCHLPSLYKVFKQIVNRAGLKLDLSPRDLLPVIPPGNPMPVPKGSIFYFNSMPKSGQDVPIKTLEDHMIVIRHLLKSHTVVVPSSIGTVPCPGLIVCDFPMDTSCKSVVDAFWTAHKCDLVISFDVGSNFLWCSDAVYTGPRWLHCATNDFHFARLTDSLRYSHPNQEAPVELVLCKDPDDLVLKLTDVLKV